MNFFTLLAAPGAAGAAGAAGGKSNMSLIFLMGGMFAIMYFVMIRPQKKKQKAEQEMRESLQIGDEITTIGGIIGRVITIKDDSLIIESGADRNKIKITRWAISTNNTSTEKAEAEREAAKEAQEAERTAKMEESQANSKARRKKSKKNKENDE